MNVCSPATTSKRNGCCVSPECPNCTAGSGARGTTTIMDARQTMHAMMLDDAYCVERVLADGAYGVTEMVSLDGAGPFVRKKMPLRLARRPTSCPTCSWSFTTTWTA